VNTLNETGELLRERVAARRAEQATQPGAEQQEALPQTEQATPTPTAPAPIEDAASDSDEAAASLHKLADLHSEGILTDEEFAAAKAKVLGI
jgi:hypothetical protein